MKTIFVITALISAACAASLSNKILGGQIAKDGQFPYEVSVRHVQKHICGGTIINEQWILTADRCVRGYYPSLLSVTTGSNTLSEGGDYYRVEKFIFHHKPKASYVYDIAVIQLRHKMVFNDKVHPIPLNTDQIPSGADLVVSGWGVTEYPSYNNSDSLKYLELKALDTEECQQRFQELGYEVKEQELCAVARNGEGACSGDYGSPLVFNGKVAGVSSWVEPCGIGYPDVYVKVSEYVDWIFDTIREN